MDATADIERAAREAAGNWRSFQCFAWSRGYAELDDPDNWAIVYTHHRDSGLLDESNAEAIAEAMRPFVEADTENPDVYEEHHSHWAVGWIDGYAIRVFRDGEITDAFRAWFDLNQQLDDYPVLDEEDYSNREHEATLENIESAALGMDYDLPEGWESEVFSWLWEHDQSAVENQDDQGGYPTQEQLDAAFDALGYERMD